MARRRTQKPKTRTIVRYKTKKAAKRKSKKSSMTGDIAIAVGGMGYGAVREKLNQQLAILTAKLPQFDLLDEVALFFVSMALKKGKIPFLNKIPITKEIGKAGMYIEAASTGQYLTRNLWAAKTMTVTNSNNSF